MVILLILLIVLVPLALLGLAAGARVLVSDGLGLRPPPLARDEQERMRSWPR